MRLLAIDPGPKESAWLVYDVSKQAPYRRGVWGGSWAKESNEGVRAKLEQAAAWGVHYLAVEMIASYGMPVGAETFETCVWIGRFLERWDRWKGSSELVYRRDVKLHLCGSARAKDGNVRQALIDRYGGKERAIGRKATPGPLYGLSGDAWAALGVAVTAAESGSASPSPPLGWRR